MEFTDNDAKALVWAQDLLKGECVNGFYGTITFKVEAGRIVTGKVERTEKPPFDTPNKKG